MSLARIFSITTLCVLIVSIAASQGFLRASGEKIVDGNSKEVLLKGIGLGGWLVPEGYMVKTDGFANSPSEIKALITDLVGQANADEFYRRYRANYVNRKDIDRIAQWGFNSIRLPMHYEFFTPRNQPGVYLEAGFAIVDSLLAWCEANHLYLILDLHCAPGGQNANNISDYDSRYPSLWQDATNRARTVDLWKVLAQRYVNKQWIGGYDLLNEPAWDLGSGNQPLRTLYIDITNAIRTVDTNHILFIEGNWFATDFNGLSPAWDANMAYSFHKYWNSNSASSIAYLATLRSSTHRPLWLGESGENSNPWFTDCITLMNAYNIGWAWWPHKKIDNIAGPLSAVKTPAYNTLLKYWTGQVPKPTVQFAVDALNGMAANLDIDRCVFQPDVLDALLRQPTSSARIPYTVNAVPGIIYAVDYDMGKRGIAYGDVDFENTGSGDAWNSGWSYRNDAVDIEACSDYPGNGYNVGWTAANEFLKYTLAVAQTGTYNVTMRVSANAAGGAVTLKWDGSPVSGLLNVPNTGGWQSWQLMNLGQYAFTAGSHTFDLFINSPGFNINCIEFTLTASDVKESEVAHTFALEQNFPNPFNPATTIRYSLPERTEVKLLVCNTLGEVVANNSYGTQEPGYHQITFDASALASGLYFYRLSAGSHTQTLKMLVVK